VAGADEIEERPHDEEHISVSVIKESEWGLGFYSGGYVTFENVEGDGSRGTWMARLARKPSSS